MILWYYLPSPNQCWMRRTSPSQGFRPPWGRYLGNSQRGGKGPVHQLAGMLFKNVCFCLNRRETQLDLLCTRLKEVLRFEDKLYIHSPVEITYCCCFLPYKWGRRAIKIYKPFNFLHFTRYLWSPLPTGFSSPRHHAFLWGPCCTVIRSTNTHGGPLCVMQDTHRSRQQYTCYWQSVAQVITGVMHLWKGSEECKEYGDCMVDTDPIAEWVGQGQLLQGSDI